MCELDHDDIGLSRLPWRLHSCHEYHFVRMTFSQTPHVPQLVASLFSGEGSEGGWHWSVLAGGNQPLLGVQVEIVLPE